MFLKGLAFDIKIKVIKIRLCLPLGKAVVQKKYLDIKPGWQKKELIISESPVVRSTYPVRPAYS